MRILVTGGAGFIGAHLVDCLLDRDHDVDLKCVITVQNLKSDVPGRVTAHKDSILGRLFGTDVAVETGPNFREDCALTLGIALQ